MSEVPHVRIMPSMHLPYYDELQSNLEAAGWRVTRGNRFPKRGILLGQRLTVLHMHMLDMLFLDRPTLPALVRFSWFLLVLLPVLKARGGRFVWTCHEIEPHEEPRRRLAVWLARRIARRADAIIVHSREMAERVRLLLRTEPSQSPGIHVLPHGTLEAYYARTTPPQPRHPVAPGAAFTFVAAGFMRHTKGTDLMLEAFRRVEAPQARLLLAGVCKDEAYYRRLQSLAGDDPRVILQRRGLTQAEMIALHAQAAVVLFAFRACATSGSLISAMSLGCCVIAPRLGHAAELVGPGLGLLYEPAEGVTGLQRQMEYALAHPEKIHAMGLCARESLRRPAWDDIIRETLTVYRPSPRQSARITSTESPVS
jgi:glycosyltransferase involved in cell wall biosynthesis